MVQTSGWLQNVPYRTAINLKSVPSVLTYDVTFVRHVTSKKMEYFLKKNISSNRQGQRSNSRSRSTLNVKVKVNHNLHYYVKSTCNMSHNLWNPKIVRWLQPVGSQNYTLEWLPIRWKVRQNCTDPKYVTYRFCAKWLPIIKHRELLHISMSSNLRKVMNRLIFEMYTCRCQRSNKKVKVKCQRSMSRISVIAILILR